MNIAVIGMGTMGAPTTTILLEASDTEASSGTNESPVAPQGSWTVV